MVNGLQRTQLFLNGRSGSKEGKSIMHNDATDRQLKTITIDTNVYLERITKSCSEEKKNGTLN